MNQITPEKIQLYLKTISYKYSEASFKRKLSSMRQFFIFLTEKGVINEKQIKDLQKTLYFEDIAHIITESTPPIKTPVLTYRQQPEKERLLEESKPVTIAYPPPKANPIVSQPLIILLTVFLFSSINIFFLGKINSRILTKPDLGKELKSLLNQTKNKTTIKIPLRAILTDNFGIPISFEQDLTFSIYLSSKSTEAMYTTGRCPITPNDDGQFSIEIGRDCGQPIPYQLFTENPELYLGISLGLGGELDSRIPLKKIQLAFTNPTPTPTVTPPIESDTYAKFLEDYKESTDSSSSSQ